MNNFPEDGQQQPEQKGDSPDIIREPLDPELPRKALDDLRQILRGNGINAEDIKLKACNGETLHFETWQVFKIETAVAEKYAHGRDGGEIAGSYTDAQFKIKSAAEKITHDREVRKQTIALLKKSEDMGFAGEDQIIKLERLSKKFVIHEQCRACDAGGKNLCAACHGHGRIVCTRCNGQRQTTCQTCHGTQFMPGSDNRQQCTTCHGRGKSGCGFCHQTGEIQCQKCKATGRVPCHQCGGTGWRSHIFFMTVKAKGNFTYDRDSLPPELPPLIDSYGARLVTESHIQARINEDTRREQELDKAGSNDEYVVPYEVKLPWGDIAFSVGREQVKGKLFGYTPLLIDLPPLLEKLAAPGIDALKLAAAGSGDTAGQIAKSIRYRVIGEIFIDLLGAGPARATATLREKYPYGIGEEALNDLLRTAQAALAHILAAPRRMAILAGSAAFAAIAGAYFLGPLRMGIVKALPPAIPEIAADAALAGSGILMVTAALQVTGAHALQKALGRLSKKASLKPRLEGNLLLGFAVSFGIFALMLTLLHLRGGALPGWIAPLATGL